LLTLANGNGIEVSITSYRAAIQYPWLSDRNGRRTTEPGLRLYSGSFLTGDLVGTGGGFYDRRAGVALETRHFPDSPHHPAFPTTVLRPGAIFASTTVYRFTQL
jgi:aldose 1-epimerase